MSFPNLPDIMPRIDIDKEDVKNLLFASIAFEELGLAHILNAEGEKIQFVLGTLPGQKIKDTSIEEILEVNKSVARIIRGVSIKEMILQFKLENILEIPDDDIIPED